MKDTSTTKKTDPVLSVVKMVCSLNKDVKFYLSLQILNGCLCLWIWQLNLKYPYSLYVSHINSLLKGLTLDLDCFAMILWYNTGESETCCYIPVVKTRAECSVQLFEAAPINAHSLSQCEPSTTPLTLWCSFIFGARILLYGYLYLSSTKCMIKRGIALR